MDEHSRVCMCCYDRERKLRSDYPCHFPTLPTRRRRFVETLMAEHSREDQSESENREVIIKSHMKRFISFVFISLLVLAGFLSGHINTLK